MKKWPFFYISKNKSYYPDVFIFFCKTVDHTLAHSSQILVTFITDSTRGLLGCRCKILWPPWGEILLGDVIWRRIIRSIVRNKGIVPLTMALHFYVIRYFHVAYLQKLLNLVTQIFQICPKLQVFYLRHHPFAVTDTDKTGQ